MRIVIVSATSGFAQAIAKNLAAIYSAKRTAELNFVLVGRNQKELELIASDLEIRYPLAKAEVTIIDMLSETEIFDAVRQLGEVDIALICQGQLTDQSAAQADPAVLAGFLSINLLSPTYFASAFAAKFDAQGFGQLGVIGSVAGDRSRRSNYVYGAAKGFLASYLQGLEHRFAGTQVGVLVIKPGPTSTKMTREMPNPPKRLAEVEGSAKVIAKALADKKSGVLYVPRQWQLIMFVIRLLPKFVFNRLNL